MNSSKSWRPKDLALPASSISSPPGMVSVAGAASATGVVIGNVSVGRVSSVCVLWPRSVSAACSALCLIDLFMSKTTATMAAMTNRAINPQSRYGGCST